MNKEGQEHLAKVRLKDGTAIDLLRTDDKAVIICHEGHEVVMPKATGLQTMGILALLAKFGDIEEDD